MHVPTEQRLSTWLTAHLQNLHRWTDPQSGRIFDPFESHQHGGAVLAESYSPATALATVAGLAHLGEPRAADLIGPYCRRITALLADESVPPFTGLFLQFFGLLAADDLKALAAGDTPGISAGQADEFIRNLCAYQVDLQEPINTNCAAMQAAVEILRHRQTGQCDWNRCAALLDLVASQQTPSGLINDALGAAAMPIAYHLFSVYLLAAGTCRADRDRLPAEAADVLAKADAIVRQGYAWLGHLLASDGMFAQYGRSRYHLFAQAAGAALLAAVQIPPDDACVRRYLAWMERHRLPAEPASGLEADLLAITPNCCPPALRVGFEPYATISVYNNLAHAILLDAARWWMQRLKTLDSAPQARRVFFEAARGRGFYGQIDCGLARLRTRDGYVLVNLQAHHRPLAPAGSLIHLRLGDDLHEKAAAPPFWADPALCTEAPHLAVWEGPALCEPSEPPNAAAVLPDVLMEGQLLEARAVQSTMALQWTGPQMDWTRTITLEPTALTLQWELDPKKAGRMVLAVVPCLLWDGRSQTTLRIDGPDVLATRTGQTWRMRILDRRNRAIKGHWYLAPDRSTLSTSGVTGRLLFCVSKATRTGRPVVYTLRTERLQP